MGYQGWCCWELAPRWRPSEAGSVGAAIGETCREPLAAQLSLESMPTAAWLAAGEITWLGSRIPAGQHHLGMVCSGVRPLPCGSSMGPGAGPGPGGPGSRLPLQLPLAWSCPVQASSALLGSSEGSGKRGSVGLSLKPYPELQGGGGHFTVSILPLTSGAGNWDELLGICFNPNHSGILKGIICRHCRNELEFNPGITQVCSEDSTVTRC